MERDEALRTPGGIVAGPDALTWSFATSGGPGGQHANRTSSRVTLVIATEALRGSAAALERVRAALGAEIRVTSHQSRSQWRNRALCLQRAAELIDAAARPPTPPRRPTRPTRASVERRLEDKRRAGERSRSRRDAPGGAEQL